MKKLIVALMMAATVATVQAALPDYIWNLDWSIVGAISPDGGDVLADYDVTWKLLNASNGDDLIATMTSENGAMKYTDEREKVLEYGAYLSPVTSTYWGATDAFDTAQNLYQRIELSKNDVIQYYWESPETTAVSPVLYDTTSIPGTPTPMNDNAIVINAADWTQAQAVPEPATMSLLGLGALAMALRRKLRK